jgi:probable H4MPT-linked C1 transfer pathway protein
VFVLDCLKSCFPHPASYVWSLSGEFVLLNEARTRPLEFAAANWLATAQWIARQFPNGLLVDVGSTTTDILPILDGQVCVSGRTDLARLSSGELVYTGVLRTNLAAIVQSVPIAGAFCRVASEYFAVSGDVHLILGHLHPQDYTCATPDGQPPSVDSACKRVARLVCADTEMLAAAEINGLAQFINNQQIHQICDGLNQVLSRLPRLRNYPVIVLGSGAFLGAEAARNAGLEIRELASDWGREASAVAASLAVAHLLAEQILKW